MCPSSLSRECWSRGEEEEGNGLRRDNRLRGTSEWLREGR
jgi:hypothetical protein